MYYVPGSLQALYTRPIYPQSQAFLLENKLLRTSYKAIYDLTSAFFIFFPLSVLPIHTLVPQSCPHAFLSIGSQPGKGTNPLDGVGGYAFGNEKGHFWLSH